MKKTFALIVSLFVLFAFNVNALTKADLKEKILGTVEINGKEYSLPSDKRKLAEDYIDKNEISDEDATYIAGKIDEAIKVAQEEKSTKFVDFSESAKEKLVEMVTDISKNTSVKASLTKEGLLVKNTDGTEVLVTSLVKQTGYESSKTAIIVAISFIIVAVGTGFVIKQVKTSE